MKILRGFWLALGLVATAVAAVVFAGSPGAASGRQAYLQFNMCGNVCNNGGVAVVRDLERTIGARRPTAVTLNEVCENQYDRLRADLTAYRGRFDPTGPVCRNGFRYGNAILARASGVDLVGSWPLPDPSGAETRRLMCVRPQPATSMLVVCVTHVSYKQTDIGAQVGAIAGILRGLDGDEPVLLGGDLNTDPTDPRLNLLYRACDGTGDFEEADAVSCGGVPQDTFARHKLDYIFLSAGHWTGARATVIDPAGGRSDHHALWASATFRDGQ
jgi:endonuclease/exonuclease/phosphatase family metal-dependent hydrolase